MSGGCSKIFSCNEYLQIPQVLIFEARSLSSHNELVIFVLTAGWFAPFLNLPAFNILARCHDQHVWGKRRYKKTLTVQMLNNIGFNISKATYRLPHLFFIILIKKVIEKISGSSKVKSDLFQLPSWLNKLFLRINHIENKLIISGINMPFGSSLFLVACKKRG